VIGPDAGRRFEGRVALVTGAARGIGRATALRLAREGARVGFLDRDAEGAQRASDEAYGPGGEVLPLVGDVGRAQDAERAVDEVVSRWGRLDILVNNAGILRDSLLFRMSTADWQEVLEVHLNGTFHCTQAAQRPMVEQGYGRILNLSSTSALGNRGQANYATAKAGIQGFTRTLAIELGPFGITVNAVAPGFIATDMTRGTADRLGVHFDKLVEEQAMTIPVRRVGTPEDVSAALLFLASEEAGFVNGQTLYVAGGPRG